MEDAGSSKIKVKLFCWQLASSVLPTRDALLSKHIPCDLMCHMCERWWRRPGTHAGQLASLCYLVLHGAVYYAACLRKAVNEKLMGRTEEGLEMSKWKPSGFELVV
nr:uncharacterized protein LOC109158082 [Ipomoea batatas]